MLETTGNIWTNYHTAKIVIPTNGFVKKNGEAVMGKGLAYQAKKIFPNLPLELGNLLKKRGNHIYELESGLISFPVKHNWWEPADISLIEKSCQELVLLDFDKDYTKVVLPRVGCGNGKLSWSVVKEILESYLSDKFIIVNFEGAIKNENFVHV